MTEDGTIYVYDIKLERKFNVEKNKYKNKTLIEESEIPPPIDEAAMIAA